MSFNVKCLIKVWCFICKWCYHMNGPQKQIWSNPSFFFKFFNFFKAKSFHFLAQEPCSSIGISWGFQWRCLDSNPPPPMVTIESSKDHFICYIFSLLIVIKNFTMPHNISRYLGALVLLACHWDLYFHSSGVQRLLSLAHSISRCFLILYRID